MSDIHDRPIVTFALFTYNQERFVREAVESTLAQTYQPLQVIISDDCSTDATPKLIQEITDAYVGPHTVQVLKNSDNIGVCAHVNAVMGEIHNDLIVVAAGDDISAPNRVEEVVKVWKRTGASAVYCGSRIIDEDSKVVGDWVVPTYQSKIAIRTGFKGLMFYGAGAAYDRQIFDRFGPLPLGIRNEDYNLAMRATLMGGVAYAPEPLLSYRQHGQNLSFWVKIRQSSGFRQAWRLKTAMYANLISNQRHILEYISDICGIDSKAYQDYRLAMLSTLLRFRIYLALGRSDEKKISLDAVSFRFSDYWRLLASAITKLPTLVVRKRKRFGIRGSG